jgi:hypothetical protein
MNMTTTIDKVREMMSFATYPPGSAMIYHVGFLINDRSRGRGRPSDETAKRAAAVNSVANIAMELAEAGKVLLTQRRLGHEIFEYIATRSSRK